MTSITHEDRLAMREVTEAVMPLVMDIWHQRPQDHSLSIFGPGTKGGNPNAAEQLNTLLSSYRDHMEHMPTGAISVALRGSGSVKAYLPVWEPMFEEAKALIALREGEEKMLGIFVGML